MDPPPKPVGKPLSGPVNRSLDPSTENAGTKAGFASTGNSAPDRETARTLALATAAKIDAIESEMARDFLRSRKGASGGPDTAPQTDVIALEPPTTQPGLSASAGYSTSPPRPNGKSDEDLDPDAALVGSVHAIEVGSNSSSALDEAAILFANGQADAAEQGLRATLASGALGASAERGWLMLLELQNQRGARAAFEETAARFAQQHQGPAPAWIDYATAGCAPAAASAGPQPASASAGKPSFYADAQGTIPFVALPAAIDASIVKPLEELKTLATTHPRLLLDVAAARSIDLVGAELLLRVFNAFRRAPHELQFAGIDALQTALRDAIEPGRRDPSDAAWMLLLEVQRLLNRQADFEETGIQYCITYEVSPPSWEPPPPNIRLCLRPVPRVQPAAPPPPAPEPAAAGSTLEWSGEILSDADPQLNRLLLAAREKGDVAVECRGLRRMAFSAASALLGHLFKLQQGGVAVEFRNVNPLVTALWQLLGVSSAADVRARRS